VTRERERERERLDILQNNPSQQSLRRVELANGNTVLHVFHTYTPRGSKHLIRTSLDGRSTELGKGVLLASITRMAVIELMRSASILRERPCTLVSRYGAR
jgi:hypothetical protein